MQYISRIESNEGQDLWGLRDEGYRVVQGRGDENAGRERGDGGEGMMDGEGAKGTMCYEGATINEVQVTCTSKRSMDINVHEGGGRSRSRHPPSKWGHIRLIPWTARHDLESVIKTVHEA